MGLFDGTGLGGTGWSHSRTYVSGGVDLTEIPLQKVSDDRSGADFAKLPQNIDRSLNAPSAAGGDDDTLWLGAPTPRQAAGLGQPEKSCPPAV